MKFGIIAEGWSDIAVIENILVGVGLIDSLEQIQPLRPERNYDETDLHTMQPEHFSNWTLVKQECVERNKIREFLVDGNIFQQVRKIIFHIDTAECGEIGYEVERPEKDKSYCENLRENVIAEMSEWLEMEFIDDSFFAVAIEETEAWVHTLYENKDTSKSADPKRAFQKILKKKNIKTNAPDEYTKSKKLSEGFQKILKKNKNCLKNNLSLKLFIESLPKPDEEVEP